MRGWIGAMLLSMVMTMTVSAHAPQGNLIMAYGDFNERPYAIVENGDLAGGFLHELGVALADALDRKALFRHLPRNRLAPELASGNVDLYCLASPSLETGFPPNAFSKPLFSEQDVIVVSHRFTGAVTLASLNGGRIGTVLGYLYPPALDSLFANGRLIREDARNDTANLRKLAGDRLDAVVLSAIGWREAIRANPALSQAVRTDILPLPPLPRTCLVSPTGAVTVEAVNGALQTLRDNGTLAGIVSRLGADMVPPPGEQAAEGPGINPANRQYR